MAAVILTAIVLAITIIVIVWGLVSDRAKQCEVCDNSKKSELRAFENPYGVWYLCADDAACDARIERRTRAAQKRSK